MVTVLTGSLGVFVLLRGMKAVLKRARASAQKNRTSTLKECSKRPEVCLVHLVSNLQV